MTSFVAVLGGRRVEGILKERQAARDEYDAAIAPGPRAALSEEDRPGVFSAQVGNLGPGETAEIELVLTGPLPYDDGEAAFRFPLVVAPRYVPGQPLEGTSAGDGTALDTDLVPDASRISPPVVSPGQPNPVNLSIEETIDSLGQPLTNLRSTLHAALIGPNRVVLCPGERLDRDFILRFGVAGAVPVTTAAVAPDEADAEEGTFAVTVAPPLDTVTVRRPLDVAVVLDRSGSMGGWTMVAARRAAARIVDTLNAGDRFLVLGFDDQIEHPRRLGYALAPATDQNRFAAVEFLAGLPARGGTEMQPPLGLAAEALASGGRDAVLVLVTDGQVAQEDVVLRSLRPHVDRIRIFTVGIDQAVNAGFLNPLADVGGGRCELVESEDALDEAMTRIHRRSDHRGPLRDCAHGCARPRDHRDIARPWRAAPVHGVRRRRPLGPDRIDFAPARRPASRITARLGRRRRRRRRAAHVGAHGGRTGTDGAGPVGPPETGLHGRPRAAAGTGRTWIAAPVPPSDEDREDLANELDELAADADDDQILRTVVSDLASAVRAWTDVERQAEAVKQALNRGRGRMHSWR